MKTAEKYGGGPFSRPSNPSDQSAAWLGIAERDLCGAGALLLESEAMPWTS
jgi:hypothetical protein